MKVSGSSTNSALAETGLPSLLISEPDEALATSDVRGFADDPPKAGKPRSSQTATFEAMMAALVVEPQLPSQSNPPLVPNDAVTSATLVEPIVSRAILTNQNQPVLPVTLVVAPLSTDRPRHFWRIHQRSNKRYRQPWGRRHYRWPHRPSCQFSSQHNCQ